LVDPEDELPLVQVRKGAAVGWPVVINRTAVVLQEGTRKDIEGHTFSVFVLPQVSVSKGTD
jgi:hypothetical protein